ncbi:MAG: Uma2 family endonuclease [Truepera sp.]|nr:Uma2 family endonuclease [Truepera sp.]
MRPDVKASPDLHDKLKVYRRSSVQEYLVWQMYEKRLDWFQLRDTDYVSLLPDEAGVLHSQVFPGLRLAVAALLAGNVAQVLAVLQQGLDSAEHKAFVDRLARAGTA